MKSGMEQQAYRMADKLVPIKLYWCWFNIFVDSKCNESIVFRYG